MWDPFPGVHVQVGVVCGPRFQTLINPLKQDNVVRVICHEVVPRALFALKAAKPEVLTRMRELTATPKDGAQVIEFIAVEFEELSCSEEGIEGLEWTTGLQFMEEEPGVAFLYIECYIMGDNDVGLIEYSPEVLH